MASSKRDKERWVFNDYKSREFRIKKQKGIILSANILKRQLIKILNTFSYTVMYYLFDVFSSKMAKTRATYL